MITKDFDALLSTLPLAWTTKSYVDGAGCDEQEAQHSGSHCACFVGPPSLLQVPFDVDVSTEREPPICTRRWKIDYIFKILKPARRSSSISRDKLGNLHLRQDLCCFILSTLPYHSLDQPRSVIAKTFGYSWKGRWRHGVTHFDNHLHTLIGIHSKLNGN